MFSLFGKPAAAPAEPAGPPPPVPDEELSPKDQVKRWQRNLRDEGRNIDRQIRSIERSEAKAKDEIKKAAKRNDLATAKLLAKELVRSRKAKERMMTSKAQMNSVSMQMGENIGLMKVTQVFSKSTEVMKLLGSLVKVPEVSATMREMAAEMERAGLISEMVEDSMSMMDPDELEGEADEEVEKVIAELTAGQLGVVGAVPTHGRAVAAPVATGAGTGRVAVAAGAGGAGGEDAELAALRRSFESMP